MNRILQKLMSDEWIEQNIETSIPQPQPQHVVQPVHNTQQVQQTITVSFDDNKSLNNSSQIDQEMKDKVYSLLDKINKPGIDFFEVWDAAEQMDGGLLNHHMYIIYYV